MSKKTAKSSQTSVIAAINAGKLGTAVSILKNSSSFFSSGDQKKIILISFRYNDYLQKNLSGLLNDETVSLRIANSILSLIFGLKKSC